MIWRWFWREWRSPSLLIVWLAMSLAVACIVALGSISDRIEQGLNQQSRDFLAGDRVLRSAYAIPQEWITKAIQQGLTVSQQRSFMTMTYAGDHPQLASVKAVDDAYPLYGKLETQPQGAQIEPGTVLIAPQLRVALNVKKGDQLDVGDATLRIIGDLVTEPDAGFNPFQTAPRILIHLADVEKTGAIQPGSKLTYRYMFAGEEQTLTKYGDFLTPQLKADQRWLGIEQSDGPVNKALARAQLFLLLSALLTLLLAVAALAVAMNHYCQSRYDLVAILKTLGAGKATLRKLILGQWGVVFLLAIASGGAIGKGFEWLMMRMLMPVLPSQLPEASSWPWVWAIGSLLFVSLLTGLRPYRQLLATLPLRVLRRDWVTQFWPLRYYLPVVSLLMLLAITSLVGFSPLVWALLLGMVLLALLLGLFGLTGLWIVRRITLRSLAFRLAINRLIRQPWHTITQLASFAFSFMLLALLVVLRGDLLERWQQQLPESSPNYFLLNITDAQVPLVREFMQNRNVALATFYPITLARLTEFNGRKATDIVAENAPGGEALNRELNLTWQAAIPDYSPIVEGHWTGKPNEVSVEQKLAEQLHIKLGDILTFSADTQTVKVEVTSFRRIDWENLRPNFYFIFPPHTLDKLPHNWLTSFHYQGEGELLTELNRQFPTITVLDVRAVLQQVTAVLQQVGGALEIMVILVLFCGVLLLLAQVQVGMRLRRQELLVYRTLGCSKRLLRQTLWAEFGLLGLIAGVTAVFAAEMALWFLLQQVFTLTWQVNPLLWIVLPLSSTLFLASCGAALGARLLRGKALFRHYGE